MRDKPQSKQSDSAPDLGPQFVMPGDVQAAATSRRVVLVPGAAAPLLALDLPAGVSGQAREQVARRQLQDRIGLTADRAEMRPFATAPRARWQRVMVADAASVAAWRAAAPRARAVLPDYLALPAADGVWVVAGLPHGVAVRFGPADGFGAGAAVALAQISARMATAAPVAILSMGNDVPGLSALAAAQGVPLVTDPRALARIKGAGALRTLGHNELSCDLRRDPQLTRVRLRRQVLPWRWPVAAALVAAGIWAAGDLLQTQRLTAQRAEIAQATQALVRTHFVPSGPILDIRAQVSQAMAARTTAQNDDRDTTAIDLFARASDVIDTTGGTLETVTSADGAALDLQVRVADFAAADALASALAANTLAVDMVEARVTARDGGVRAALRITPGPGAGE
ncbi:MAG: type II secretion system protein GspL [Pseudomonadota bacterium]